MNNRLECLCKQMRARMLTKAIVKENCSASVLFWGKTIY